MRIIKSAAKSNPIEVLTLKHRDIVAWKTMASELVTNRKILSNDKTLAFNKVKWFRFEKERPGKVKVAYRIDPTQQQ